MRKIIITAVVTAAGLAAVPATAQYWRIQPSVQRQIQRDINQLDTRIARAADRRTISRREANGLQRDANRLQRLLNLYSRNGLNRTEVAALETGVNRLHLRLRLERRDWDGRRG